MARVPHHVVLHRYYLPKDKVSSRAALTLLLVTPEQLPNRHLGCPKIPMFKFFFLTAEIISHPWLFVLS